MSFGGAPKPPNIPLPPPAAHPAILANQQVVLAGKRQQKAGAAAQGMGAEGTIATSAQGALQKPTTAQTTLLGG